MVDNLYMNILISSIDENRVIGFNGKIPWDIPEFVTYFEDITIGHTIVTGRTTWASMQYAYIYGRRNIVLTKNPEKWSYRVKDVQHKDFGPFFVKT